MSVYAGARCLESSFLMAGSVADMGFWKRPSGKAIILYQGALWRGEPRTFLMAVGWERLISEGAMRTRWPGLGC